MQKKVFRSKYMKLKKISFAANTQNALNTQKICRRKITKYTKNVF